MAQVVDSYSESNQNALVSLYDQNVSRAKGQSFTGDGGTLDSAKWHLSKIGSPTGNAVVYIYAHTGTFGTSSATSTEGQRSVFSSGFGGGGGVRMVR